MTGSFANMTAVPNGRLVIRLAILLVAIAGCDRQSSERPDETDGGPGQRQAPPIRILVLDDPPLAEAIQRQWESREPGRTQVNAASLTDALQAKRLNSDLVIYPTYALGSLAESGVLAALSDEALDHGQLAWDDIFAAQRLVECQWGPRTYAAPLGSTLPVMLYRADLFQAIRRSPPSNWEDLIAALPLLEDPKAFQDRVVAEGWVPMADPRANTKELALNFLIRAASYVRHPSQYSALFDYESMQPMLNEPSFARALELWIEQASGSSQPLTNRDAMRMIFEGRTAVAMGWLDRNTLDEIQLNSQYDIQVASIPGALEAFNHDTGQWEPHPGKANIPVPVLGIEGRLVSVTQEAQRSRDAEQALAWLCGQDWSVDMSPASQATMFFRKSQRSQADRWLPKGLSPQQRSAFFATFETELSRPTVLVAVRIPGRERYLEALGTQLALALQGESTPTDALQAATERWEQITDELGRDAQRRAYLHSLTLEP